jgi:hypothetical protein
VVGIVARLVGQNVWYIYVMSAGNLQGTAKKRKVYLDVTLLKDSVTTSQKTPLPLHRQPDYSRFGAQARYALCESQQIHEGKMQSFWLL